MPQSGVVKETIVYLNFWLGVMVVSGISLVGRGPSDADVKADFRYMVLSIGTVVITVSACFVHKKRIEYMTLTLKELS